VSAYSNRAIYNPAGGRALWGGADGRALYAGPAWLSHIYQSGYAFYGVDYVSGSSAWTQANYQQCQTDATNALRADTTLSYQMYDAYEAYVAADAGYYYGEDVSAYHYAGYQRYTLPTGKRGSIVKVRVKADVWAGSFWNLDLVWIYTQWVHSAFDDFGCALKLFFRDSAHPFASGAAMLDATPDASFTLADINAAHVAAGTLLPSITNGNPEGPYPSLILNCDAAAGAVNALANDNLYLWSCITRPSFMPFLFADPGSYTIDYDFACRASFKNVKLLVAAE
jgi:hypothetical protein